ncbi:MAG: hypothetical protein LBQ50_07455 [Planctomycetaceae bacterium]|nr:hypothetical protein [Planctomycetaceae bacterium]
MKKLLTLAIVFSLALVLNSVSFAQEAAVPEGTPIETAVVENGQAVQGCYPVPHPCPFRPFVRRPCTPYIANPCNPCPPCAPQPVCAPVPRKLCGAPVQPPCVAEQVTDPCADPCGYGYAGYQRTPIRNLLSRLFSRGGHDPYYSGYGEPEWGYGSGCPCGH